MAKNIIPKKVKDSLNTGLPNSATEILKRNLYIKEQIKADYQEVMTDGFSIATHDFINPKGNGIENFADRETFKTANKQVGSFYISLEELLNFLFDSSFIGENAIIGFWIFFTPTAKDGTAKIVLTKAGKSASNRTKILSEDYTLLTYNKFPEANIPKINPASLGSSNARPSIATLRAGFIAPIRGYFIGREVLMNKIAGSEGNIPANIKGIEMDVRQGRAYDMVSTSTDIYSVIFNLIFKDTNEVDTIGIATKRTHIHAGGGGSSSRPCPTYCPE